MEEFPQANEATDVKFQEKIMLICFFGVKSLIHFEFVPEGTAVKQTFYVDILYSCRETQARRVVKRSLNDSCHDKAPAYLRLECHGS
jgi:hypothetical protein